MRKLNFNKIISFLLIALFFIVSSGNLIAETNENYKKVKVGYFENEIFQEGAEPGYIKKGYAYEYYRKLSEYSGWEYEYVYGDFIELYNKLVKGEIDFLAGLAYTNERAQKINYADSIMGSTFYYLMKKNNVMNINSNPSSIDGKKIGVMNSIMVQQLEKWIEKNNVKAQIVVFNNNEKLFDAYDSDSVDLIMVEGAGTYGRDDSDAIICIGQTDYYLCVSKSRPKLLAELNKVLLQLFSDDPYYVNTLLLKYYSKSITSRAFSADESRFLGTTKNITIGYLKDYMPYCDIDSNGNLTGLLKDIIPDLSGNLGLTDRIKVTYKDFNSFTELITSLTKNEIDVAFPVGGGLYFSEKEGFYQSKPVINSSVGLVYYGNFEKQHKPVFAANKNNNMQSNYIRANFPDCEIKFYDSINDCLKAIIYGEVDYTTVNGIRINSLLKNTQYKKLQYRLLAQSDERCFGVGFGNENLLRILNRGISTLGEQGILNKAYSYSETLYKYTITDIIKNVVCILIPLVIITGSIIIILNVKSKKLLTKLNNELQKALENRERYITDMIRYASSEDDADKILNQIVEYIGKNTKSDRVYVFEENKEQNFDNTYEWCNRGISKEIDNLQNIPYEGVMETWINEFKKHGCVTIRDVEKYKEINESIYEILKPQNINTLAAIPILINSKIIGFIGVDNPPAEKIKDTAEFLTLIEFFFSMMIRLRNNALVLAESAVHDQLTGCKNRKALVWAYNQEFDKEKSLAVIAVDMNGLKNVNDNQGHESGDKFICRTADTLCDVFGKENIYRIGGDEFTVVLVGKTKEELEVLMNNYADLAGTTASVGYSFEEKSGEIDFAEMLKQADFEMYKAKDKFYQDKRKKR